MVVLRSPFSIKKKAITITSYRVKTAIALLDKEKTRSRSLLTV
jgi:hypothetical protein